MGQGHLATNTMYLAQQLCTAVNKFDCRPLTTSEEHTLVKTMHSSKNHDWRLEPEETMLEEDLTVQCS